MPNANDKNILVVHHRHDQMGFERVSPQTPARLCPLARRPGKSRQKLDAAFQTGGVLIGLPPPKQVLATGLYVLEIRLRPIGWTIH